jgi:NitT/TauT family transport system ATP-binding protein
MSPVKVKSDVPTDRESNAATIELRAIKHTYRTRDGSTIHAVAEANLVVKQGEFVAVIGPSGCGKSTLLKIIGGMVRPTAGEVLVQGRSPISTRPNFGMVFQSPVLLPWRNIAENVGLPMEIRGIREAARGTRVSDLLALVDLSGFEAKSPRELSGGMQQRVALARALANDPPLLLLDEPFGALDALTREQLNVELASICRRTRKTAVLVTHSISEAIFLADRVVVMGPRPATIRRAVTINLPRPRALNIMGSNQFGQYMNEIREVLTGTPDTNVASVSG